ncbi:MAG: hypothetical protein K0U08_03300 [Proteobacteria bacterium]|nr:hypothetical protein [Pseudomonadota bacterium]
MPKLRIEKIKYKCLSNGVIAHKGQAGICGYNIVGDNSLCGAHGNTKCPHKVKRKLDKD